MIFFKLWITVGILLWLLILILDYKIRGYDLTKADFTPKMCLLYVMVILSWPFIAYSVIKDRHKWRSPQ